MSVTTRTRRSRRTITTAATLGVVLATGTLLLSAPAAFAETAPEAKLTVQAPASVGFAGQPVEFTETISNPTAEDAGYHLYLSTTTELGTPPDAIVIDYKDPADGAWKSVPLEFATNETAHYDGELPSVVTVPAGGSTTLKLRIGAPMGLPHHGASNGGFRSIDLRSAVSSLDGSHVALDQSTKTIGVDSISTSLAHVPAAAVAGGAPIEFDAVLANPTLSDYINVGNVLFTDTHATVQVRKADGSWSKLAQVLPGAADTQPGVYLEGRDSAIRSGTTTTTRVRVSFDATTPAGDIKLNPCVFVNEGKDTPFRGTTHCAQGATVKVTAATGTQSPAPAPSSTAPTTPAPSATATASASAPVPTTPATPTTSAPSEAPVSTDGRLAETGAGRAPALLAAGASLLTAGGGALWLARRRRSA
ncbi:LPXTG cell wall anchor domain-containing protein [Kitasatospora sp. NBC_00240]|uniref:LPXTG cell wall anchor domain-containing protein n=1 Tax=Kitasatospora sp. NBC_00240 TaxID=2903567 RepID=UPI0022526A69|nr:LPXTG cell wall anchor domain-containing protein [Kitasatospora sp. NBC_00240]MCX5212011.1 LPXTG cell wall anchor domain-containing protein [Kitasatospora sp. NBC_00240]